MPVALNVSEKLTVVLAISVHVGLTKVVALCHLVTVPELPDNTSPICPPAQMVVPPVAKIFPPFSAVTLTAVLAVTKPEHALGEVEFTIAL